MDSPSREEMTPTASGAALPTGWAAGSADDDVSAITENTGTVSQGGLGRSTPLVTVSGGFPGGVPIAVSTTTMVRPSSSADSSSSVDLVASPSHPLEEALVPPPMQLAPPQQEQQQHPLPTASEAATALPPPPTVGTQPPALEPPPWEAPQQQQQKQQQRPYQEPGSIEADVDRFLSEGKVLLTSSGLLYPPPLNLEEEGLAKAAALGGRRAWGDVLQVTNDCLHSAMSPHAPLYSSLLQESDMGYFEFDALRASETAELIALRILAMLQLRRYVDLGQLVEKLNIIPSADETSKRETPSWIPWGLKILAAETLQYTDKPQRCIDTLYLLRSKLKESKVKAWIGKIDNALANAFVRQHEWRLAITSYQLLLEQSLPILAPAQAQILLEKAKTESVPVSLENNESSVSDALYAALEIEILSRQGRILLQVGALEEASVVFDTAANAMQRLEDTGITIEFMSKSLAIQQAPAQVLLNEGLLQFSNHTYASAMESFTRALEWLSQPKGGANKRKSKMSTGNLLLLYNPSTIAQDVLGPGITCDSNHNVMTECLNNLALCALYQCQMHTAVENMESLVRQNPTLYLTEGLVFNLCTLYELGSDTADSGRKKRVLQSIAKRFFLHDIGPESFRIT